MFREAGVAKRVSSRRPYPSFPSSCASSMLKVVDLLGSPLLVLDMSCWIRAPTSPGDTGTRAVALFLWENDESVSNMLVLLVKQCAIAD